MRAVIALARNLGLEVVAEGIETVMQLDLLKALGCAQGQGYYFSEAVCEESATELIQKEERGEFLDLLAPTPTREALFATKQSATSSEKSARIHAIPL